MQDSSASVPKSWWVQLMKWVIAAGMTAQQGKDLCLSPPTQTLSPFVRRLQRDTQNDFNFTNWRRSKRCIENYWDTLKHDLQHASAVCGRPWNDPSAAGQNFLLGVACCWMVQHFSKNSRHPGLTLWRQNEAASKLRLVLQDYWKHAFQWAFHGIAIPSTFAKDGLKASQRSVRLDWLCISQIFCSDLCGLK